VTDPELIEVFDNFAFDEVLAYGNLDTRIRMMVILASMIASQALGEYKAMMVGALNLGVTPGEIKEIVYQAVPYVGISKVYDFIHAANEILQPWREITAERTIHFYPGNPPSARFGSHARDFWARA